MPSVSEEVLMDLKRLVRHPGYDPELPPCPLCGAPALKGYGFATPFDIAHDCDCVRDREEEYLRALRQLYREYRRPKEYAESLPPGYRPYLEREFLHPRGWPERQALESFLERAAGSLYLHGPPGTGKTLLAVRLGLALARKGKRVLFLSEADLYRRARREELGEAPKLGEVTDALVLDDLGKAKPTGFAAMVLYEVFEAAWRGDMALVVTSNLAPKEAFARMGMDPGPLLSRVGQVVTVPGRDGRG
uniref:Cell division protein ZapE n=1 Tax=Thermus caliditerrae TaxID=1330700 RepID=A0A7C5RDQ6_9DEIN